MKVKVQDIEIHPNSFAVMELNFGQSHKFSSEILYYATVEFPQEYVMSEILDSFKEIKEDAATFADDWDEKWEKEICKYSSYEDFRKVDTGSNVFPFLQFISHSMLMKLQMDKHIGSNSIPEYILCAFLEDSIRVKGNNIEMSGICIKTEQSHSS